MEDLIRQLEAKLLECQGLLIKIKEGDLFAQPYQEPCAPEAPHGRRREDSPENAFKVWHDAQEAIIVKDYPVLRQYMKPGDVHKVLAEKTGRTPKAVSHIVYAHKLNEVWKNNA